MVSHVKILKTLSSFYKHSRFLKERLIDGTRMNVLKYFDDFSLKCS